MAVGLGTTSLANITRETMRNLIVTSEYGRRSGLDALGYQVGEFDVRTVIDNIITTVPTSLSASGISVFSATTASSAAHTLFTGVPGVYKQLAQISSSTLGVQVKFGANAMIVSTFGTSFNSLTFKGFGASVNLFCLASGTSLGSSEGALWLATGTLQSSDTITHTTY